jgi:hypothetical protein
MVRNATKNAMMPIFTGHESRLNGMNSLLSVDKKYFDQKRTCPDGKSTPQRAFFNLNLFVGILLLHHGNRVVK